DPLAVARRFDKPLFRPVLGVERLHRHDQRKRKSYAFHGIAVAGGLAPLGGRWRRRRLSRFSTEDSVETPTSSAVKHHEQEEPAIKNGQLAFVRDLWSGARDRKKLRHRRWGVGHVNHEISHGHLAAADEC